MDLIEALADAIYRFEGWIPAGVDPRMPHGSRSWRNRNPGNLRPRPGQVVPIDEEKYRVFPTFADGWNELRGDISAKLAGSHGLTDQSTIRNFFDVYAPSDDSNDPDKYSRQVAAWLSRDFATPVTSATTLGYLKGLEA